jgi:hypothetical protein
MMGNPAVRHMIDTIKAFDHSFIVRNHNDRSASHASQLPEQIHHRLTPLRIQCRSRLIIVRGLIDTLSKHIAAASGGY